MEKGEKGNEEKEEDGLSNVPGRLASRVTVTKEIEPLRASRSADLNSNSRSVMVGLG